MSLPTKWSKLYPELDTVLKQLVDTAHETIGHDNPDDDDELLFKKIQEYLNQYLDEKLTDLIEAKKVAMLAKGDDSKESSSVSGK